MQNAAGGGGRVHLRLQLNHTESTQRHEKKRKKHQSGSDIYANRRRPENICAQSQSARRSPPLNSPFPIRTSVQVCVCVICSLLLSTVWCSGGWAMSHTTRSNCRPRFEECLARQRRRFSSFRDIRLPSTMFRLCNYTAACMEVSSNQPAVDMSLTEGVSPWRIFIAQRGAAQGNPKLWGWWMILMNILHKCITGGGKK